MAAKNPSQGGAGVDTGFDTLLVTGGAGFIGSNFVHRTLRQRPHVRIIVVDAMTYAANPLNLVFAPSDAERVTIIEGDLSRTEVCQQAVATLLDAASAQQNGRAAIVHFAAESHNDNSLRDPLAFVRSNVEATVALAHEAARADIHFHHISTDEVFGELPLDSAVRFTVESPYQPSSPYSASKAAADLFVRAAVRSLGLRATISNCSNNYGPRQHPEKFIPRQITGLMEGERPRLYAGSAGYIRDWIHVDDHNDAVWAILDAAANPDDDRVQGRAETFLIGANGERSNGQVIADLLTLFGRASDDFVEVTDRPGHDQRYAIDPSSIETLGWQPRYTRFVEGLEATVQWYRENPQWWQASRAAAEASYRAVEQELEV